MIVFGLVADYWKCEGLNPGLVGCCCRGCADIYIQCSKMYKYLVCVALLIILCIVDGVSK